MTEIEDLKEELFCTKYELDAFAGILLNEKAERWVPLFTGTGKDEDHINRYELACGFVNNCKVLDIACGAGLGTKLLAEKGRAASVTGADIDKVAVRYAKHRYPHPAVSYLEVDGLNLDFNNEFDVVVSFETIEHIQNFNRFLHNIQTVLKQNGIFIVSTPVSSQTFDSNPLNPYHTQEWGFTGFQQVLTRSGFTIDKVFTQLNLTLGGPGLSRRIIKRLTNRKKNIRHYTGYEEKRMEEFTGQYDIAEFGKIRNGFQVVVCHKTGAGA